MVLLRLREEHSIEENRNSFSELRYRFFKTVWAQTGRSIARWPFSHRAVEQLI